MVVTTSGTSSRLAASEPSDECAQRSNDTSSVAVRSSIRDVLILTLPVGANALNALIKRTAQAMSDNNYLKGWTGFYRSRYRVPMWALEMLDRVGSWKAITPYKTSTVPQP
ncbi:uncharacterized protein N7506_000308 [Penicillium brevicompactum]|nr:uncharacterized protein N7506_000308 [Penicillium brevicompactum]KAJ5347055.1 hypothetical protein N7506_000308 [Penicillium brevicompactum]